MRVGDKDHVILKLGLYATRETTREDIVIEENNREKSRK